jgi:hypothetical protein
MVISKLPSVGRAQESRGYHLYAGPINDLSEQSARFCESRGPAIVYISKIATDSVTNEKIAFGRIYSGTIQTCMKLKILGHGAEEKGLVEVSPIIWIGHRKLEVQSVTCGNVVGIRGIDQAACTLTGAEDMEVFPIRPISFYLMKGIQIEDVCMSVGGTRSFFCLMMYSGLFSHQRLCLEWFWALHCTNEGGASWVMTWDWERRERYVWIYKWFYELYYIF